MKLLAGVLFFLSGLHVLQFAIVDRLPEDLQWVSWDVVVLISGLGSAAAVYFLIEPKYKITRIAATLLFWVAAWSFVDYLLLTIMELSEAPGMLRIRFITSIIFVFLFVIQCINCVHMNKNHEEGPG